MLIDEEFEKNKYNNKAITIFLIFSFALPFISLILIKYIHFFQKGIPYLFFMDLMQLHHQFQQY